VVGREEDLRTVERFGTLRFLELSTLPGYADDSTSREVKK